MTLIGEKLEQPISFFLEGGPCICQKKHDGLIRHIDIGVLGRVVYQR